MDISSDKWRAGDIVHVRCTLQALGTDFARVEIIGIDGAKNVIVRNSSIVNYEPAPLKAGDSVRRRPIVPNVQEPVGKLIAISGDSAWVQWSGVPVTLSLSDLVSA